MKIYIFLKLWALTENNGLLVTLSNQMTVTRFFTKEGSYNEYDYFTIVGEQLAQSASVMLLVLAKHAPDAIRFLFYPQLLVQESHFLL